MPVVLFLSLYFKKPWLHSIVAVLSAYLCCQPRRWFGTLALAFWGSTSADYLLQILITVPLLVLLVKQIAPPAAQLIAHSRRSLILFGMIPLLYYLFAYTTAIYTDIIYKSNKAVVEFIPALVAIFYFVFVVKHFNELQKRFKIENEHQIITLQAKQAQNELESMRRSQKQAAIYHHDLRHHLQFLNSSIESGKLDEAQAYIKSVSSSIEKNMVVRYCENETINVIISAFTAKTKREEILFSHDIKPEADINVSSSDLCVVLSNGLENAFNACLKMNGKRFISLFVKNHNSKTFLQIQNSYEGYVHFANELPISTDAGHGFGIKSILMTIEKLNGLCDFSAENGVFTFRATL